MKKKVLPLAVGTATAVVMSAANAAMYVNDKGMGETLIFLSIPLKTEIQLT